MGCSTCMVVLVLSSLQFVRLKAASIQNNVDVEEPFIIKSPASDVDGFGWATIFHQQEVVQSNDNRSEVLRKTRVLIGAPRGTYPGGLALDDPLLRASDRTGLVYSCPIGLGSCEGVTGNRDVYIGPSINPNITNAIGATNGAQFLFPQAYSEGRLFDQAPDGVFTDTIFGGTGRVERKEGQLMGSFLTSDGDNVIACAPRWIFSESGRAEPRGICFTGLRSLTGFVTTAPCTRSGGREGRFCSTGLSGVLANGNTAIGITGYQKFTGAIATRTVSANVEDAFSIIISRDSVPNLYFGFSVTSGYLTNPRSGGGTQDVVASSPRQNGDTYTGGVYLVIFPPMLLAEGRQTGEFFGHSITLVDLTGDGYDELVVGAPMYTSTDDLDFLVERGRVFIFFNDGAGNLDSSNPYIITGTIALMRFGFTVANAGDLDADGIADLVISAPYEKSSTQSTGAIYVYYGKNNRTEFELQSPQRIHADDIVENVEVVTVLRTFGFSVSGGIDVDNNLHMDLVVGGYVDKTVVVLRTRPFVNVMLNISDVPDADLETKNSFFVEMKASYSSRTISGTLEVQFRIQELRPNTQEPRLFFAGGNSIFEGSFRFAPQSDTFSVQVFYDVDGNAVIPYQLGVELIDVERVIPPVTNLDLVPDLNPFPRFRLLGDNTLSVGIKPLCNLDGCISDVKLVSISPPSAMLVAGRNTSAKFTINFANIGQEEARNLRMVFTNLPTNIFGMLMLALAGAGGAAFPCKEGDPVNGRRNASCDLLARLRPSESQSVVFTLPINSATFLGNEEDFTLNLEILVSTAENNLDSNTSNNNASILFQLDSVSDIRVVSVSFPRDVYMYENMIPTAVESSSALGVLERLTVRVGNAGPSTIQEAKVNVYFPARDPMITMDNYYLYPRSFSPSTGMVASASGTLVTNCTLEGIDPDNLDPETSDEPLTRKKRGVAMSLEGRRLRRAARAEANRLARQEEVTDAVTLNCKESPSRCDKFSCDILKLTTETFDLLLDFAFDDRFYGRVAAGRTFTLTAYATVEVLSEFQQAGDNKTNNMGMGSLSVQPPVVINTGGPALYHAIIWPIIAGVIILVVLVVILYFVGFFRRKKMPGEEEVEGDFSTPSQPTPEEKGNPVITEVTAVTAM